MSYGLQTFASDGSLSVDTLRLGRYAATHYVAIGLSTYPTQPAIVVNVANMTDDGTWAVVHHYGVSTEIGVGFFTIKNFSTGGFIGEFTLFRV